MLWEAGQDRVSREARERLSELYVGVNDAIVAANVRAGVWKTQGSYREPEYTRGDALARKRSDLRKLVADLGGSVERGPRSTEFTH